MSSPSLLKPAGRLVVLTAPSGGGKTTLASQLVDRLDFAVRSVSWTTRDVRKGETPGEHYHFVDESTFAEHKKQGGFLETTKIYNGEYGTPREAAEQALHDGHTLVTTLDYPGADAIRRAYPNHTTTIFILPPSLEELRARLKGRGREPDSEIQRRLSEAVEEIRNAPNYDYLVVNYSLPKALDELTAILVSERVRTQNYTNIEELDRWRV